jgi:hypothetical protein
MQRNIRWKASAFSSLSLKNHLMMAEVSTTIFFFFFKNPQIFSLIIKISFFICYSTSPYSPFWQNYFIIPLEIKVVNACSKSPVYLFCQPMGLNNH